MQRTITRKNDIFFNFHQVIYSLSYISCLSLKLLAVTVFEISYCMAKFAKGNNSKKIFFFIFTSYCLAVEAGFYSDVVECLPLDPAAQVRFPPRAVGIFLHPVTFGGQYVGTKACVSGITQQEMSRNNSVVPTRFGDESI